MGTTTHDAPRGAAATQKGATAKNPTRRGPVLLASDGTETTGAPVLAALVLAERLGVPLEVVTVLEPLPLYGGGLAMGMAVTSEVEEARRDAREAAVMSYVARFSGGASPPLLHTRYGSISHETARVARERSATVVVVGAAPHHRLTRIIAGERAAQVLRTADCPVLSVPPGFGDLPRSALVAVDFGPSSVRAAQAALLVLGDGGVLTLLHVLSPLMGETPLKDQVGRDPSGAVQTLFGRLRDELRPYAPSDVTVETRLVTDDPVAGILGNAQALGADLVVVGTHGPRFLERLFVGSVASSVLHGAEQPVLACPPPPAAESLELWRRISGRVTSERPEEWRAALDAFTRRNLGRSVMLEVDDPEIGARVTGHGYALAGVTYDPADRRVEIMVGDPADPRRHLMRSVVNPEAITLTAGDDWRDEVLDVRHGDGHTLVAIAPAPVAPGMPDEG